MLREYRNRRSARSGLTLIELLMVLVIIGLWAQVAAPRVAEGLARQRAAAAAERIARDLDLARRIAVTTSAGVRVVFDTNLNRYTLTPSANTLPQAQGSTVELAQEPYGAELTRVNFLSHTSGGSSDTVVFDGYGFTAYSGTALVSVGNAVRSVVLDGTTGRVYVP